MKHVQMKAIIVPIIANDNELGIWAGSTRVGAAIVLDSAANSSSRAIQMRAQHCSLNNFTVYVRIILCHYVKSLKLNAILWLIKERFNRSKSHVYGKSNNSV